MNDINQPLIYEGVDFEKEASTELPYDESKWIIAITQEIYEQVPSLENVEYDIELKKTDSAQGYGYGAIKAENFTIPIVIKDSRLMPLDVFIDSDGRAWPVGNGYLEKYISDYVANYGKLTKKRVGSGGVNMIDRLNAPDTSEQGIVQETPIFASDDSMISNIFKDKNEIEKIASVLRADPNIISSFRKNRTDSFIKKALEEKKDVEQSPDVEKAEPFVVEKGSTAKIVDDNGVYIVKGRDGKYYKCDIMKNVIGFDLKPKDCVIAGCFRNAAGYDEKVFAFQSNVAGINVGDKKDAYSVFDPRGEKGDFGCFIIEKEGKLIAFEPVTLLSLTTYSEDKKITVRNNDSSDTAEINKSSCTREYLVQDMLGKQFKVFCGNKYAGVTKENGNYYMSDDVKFRSLPTKLIKLSENPSEINSQAQATKETNPVTIKVAGSIVSVNEPWASEDLRGGTFIKKAKDELSKYYKREPLDEVLKEASEKGSVLITPPLKTKKVSDAVVADIPEFDTVKIASSISDPETVDKILSLNFLNPANINKFKEYVPDLRNTLSKLADLLLASRLGLDVPSMALKTAMDSLGEAITFLEQVDKEDK